MAAIHFEFPAEEASALIESLRLVNNPHVQRLREKLAQALIDRSDRTCQAYQDAARHLYGRDGELEIEEDTVVSVSDDPGAYVLSWLWITDEEAGVERSSSARPY